MMSAACTLGARGGAQEFIMQHGLEASDLMSIFTTFDSDGNGWLDMQEFKYVLPRLDPRL